MADDSSSQPRVWLDMDQAALDRAYDQAQHAPNLQQVLGRYERMSERTRQRLGLPSRHRYGPGPAEELDRFMPEGARSGVPVVLFIHGGAWRGGFARNYAFIAEPFVTAGCAVLVVDFQPVTELDGDLARMTDQIRRAIAWVAANAPALGIDPARVHLVGHSSGGHLAAAASATDWAEQFSLRGSPIASLTVCSGLYDLLPVSLSARSSYVRFTRESIGHLSPIRHLRSLSVPLTVAWGSIESPEFQRQAREYADAAESAGIAVTRVFAEGFNHFEILETLANPYGLLGSVVLDRISGADAGASSKSAQCAMAISGASDDRPVPAGEDPDTYWMRLALEASREAFERGDWPTGAALVRDGRLLSIGQNRQTSQCDLTVHAEADAIRRAIATAGMGATEGATLYCTMEPCPMCAGALKNAGITRVVLALRHARLRRTDLGRYTLEAFSELTGWQPELRSGVLEGEYLALRLRWGRDRVEPPADSVQ